MKPIRRIDISGFGPFEGATFEIPEAAWDSKVVLFEGPNGSGKTTLLEALACAVDGPGFSMMKESTQMLRRGPVRTSLAAPDDRLRGRARGTPLSIAVTCADGTVLDVPHIIDEAALRPPNTVLNLSRAAQSRPELDAFRRGLAKDGEALSWATFAYSGAGRDLSLEAEGPGAIKVEPLHGALAFDHQFSNASALGTFLMNLDYDRARTDRRSREETSPEQREALTARAGQFDDAIASMEAALPQLHGRKISIDFPLDRRSPRVRFDGEEIPVEFLGDGIRRTFSWVVDLLVRLQRINWADSTRSPLEQDFWLLLDEVDESLHPTMQIRLLPALRRLFPNAQLYVATHSPFVVASVGEGVVFSIRPNDRTHLVSGSVPVTTLAPGRSIEWVVEQVFEAPATFVDAPTQDALARHQEAVRALRGGQAIDWDKFCTDRDWLLQLNSEVSAIVLFREAPVRGQIEAFIRSQHSEAV